MKFAWLWITNKEVKWHPIRALRIDELAVFLPEMNRFFCWIWKANESSVWKSYLWLIALVSFYKISTTIHRNFHKMNIIIFFSSKRETGDTSSVYKFIDIEKTQPRILFYTSKGVCRYLWMRINAVNGLVLETENIW